MPIHTNEDFRANQTQETDNENKTVLKHPKPLKLSSIFAIRRNPVQFN